MKRDLWHARLRGMAKKREARSFKLNIVTGDLSELSGTDSPLPHPGGTSIPLVSPESQAATGAVSASRDVRAGDTGFTEDGKPYVVVPQRDRKGRKMRGLVMIVFPKDWSFAKRWDRPPDKPI